MRLPRLGDSLSPPALTSFGDMGPVTLGVDLASQTRDTAICALEWSANDVILRMLAVGEHEKTPLHDKFLVTTIAGMRLFEEGEVVKAGIDAPFGWPDEFVEAVRDYHWGGRWPSGMDNPRTPFYWRETDVWVRAHAKKMPLSVSTDKIAIVAMRCAVLLDDLRARRGPEAVDRTGTGLVCEVYPDPALRHWTGKHERSLSHRETYKGKPALSRRREIVAILRERIPLTDPEGLLRLCIAQDHALDAMVAALVARAVALGLTESPPNPERSKREGWIHLPRTPLASLLTPD